ncbi:MAG: protein kinase [Deltaproteobacteria bacterium]
MFLLLEEVGSGAAGTAHLAVRSDVRTDELFVVKRLRPEVAAQPEHLQRFSHEARIAVMVDHPNVVQVVDVVMGAQCPYLVMRYVEGPTLAALLRELRLSQQRLSVPAAVGLVRDALAGLHALHEARHPETGESIGFVHRDLSPRNLIATRDGTVCLIDLGLGRSRLGEWQTEAGRIMGSLGYMPPEQIRGVAVDHRADLWSIASVLFELLTLEQFVPGRGRQRALNTLETSPRSLRSLRDDVPEGLDEVVMRALSMTPAARFESAASFARALAETVPERAPAEVTSVVDFHFGEELDERARRLREVALTVVAPSPIAESYERIASRPSAEDPTEFGVFDATQVRPAPTRVERPSTPSEVLQPSVVAPRRSTPWAALAVLAAIFSVAAVVYLWSRAPAEPAPSVPRTLVEVKPRARGVPSVVAPEPSRRDVARATTSRQTRPPSAKAPPPIAPVDAGVAPAVEPPAPPSRRERVARLSKRLQSLRAEHGDAAERLIMQLTALDLVTDEVRHAEQLARIEREVAALDGP